MLKGGLNVLYIEGDAAGRAEVHPPGAGRLARHQSRLSAPRSAAAARRGPADLAERFQPGKYEVYILGDVDSTAFSEAELQTLAEAVNHGAGLIMLGGFHSFGPGGYCNTPLADVLPVVMDRLGAAEAWTTRSASDLHLPGPLQMRPTPLGQRHFALMLAGSRGENMALWDKLPPLEGANQFLRAGPRRRSCWRDAGEGKPLLVAHNFGNGRVLAFGGDSTWHWWMHGFEAAHKRFWRQIVLWLARKDQATEGSVWVKLEKRPLCARPSASEFTAGAQSPSGEPIKDAEYKAEVVLPDGSDARPLVHQESRWSARSAHTQAAGDYAIEVTATQKGPVAGNRPGPIHRLCPRPGTGQCLGRRRRRWRAWRP